jgi:hypothetical protein
VVVVMLTVVVVIAVMVVVIVVMCGLGCTRLHWMKRLESDNVHAHESERVKRKPARHVDDSTTFSRNHLRQHHAGHSCDGCDVETDESFDSPVVNVCLSLAERNKVIWEPTIMRKLREISEQAA